MTPPAPRHAAAAALLILAGSLMGCAGPAEPANPAHSIWAIPTNTAPPSATPTVSPTQTATAGSTTDPTTNSPPPLATDPTGPTDTPTPTTEIFNPTYDINHIDRADPAQIAWAYLTHRLSHSYTDPGPAFGLEAAARYATPEFAEQLADQATAADDTWADLQTTKGTAIVTVTHLGVYTDQGRTTVIATWTFTITADNRGPRSTAGLSVTLTLVPDQNAWLISADGLNRPS